MLFIGTVKADNIKKSTSKIGVNTFYNDAVSFVERGVKFHVFLNGDFDFNTHHQNTSYYDYNGNRTKRYRGVRIEKDYRGRIRRVGNTFINYDYRGNVKRIGSVFIDYRFGQLSRVGNLRVSYDRWGSPHFYGRVKYNTHFYNNHFSIGFGDIFDYDDDYFYRRDFRNNYKKYKEDTDFYYYKAKTNAKIGKRSKVLKRRKKGKRIYKKRNSDTSIYDYKNHNDKKPKIRRKRRR